MRRSFSGRRGAANEPLYLLAERTRLLANASAFDGDGWCRNGIRGERWSENWMACCERRCGVCAGLGCGKRPGGAAACCPVQIAQGSLARTGSRKCVSFDDVPCMIQNSQSYSGACVRGVDGHRCLPCMRGLLNGTACCAKECGRCADDLCEKSARCCPRAIRARCRRSRDVGCAVTLHSIGVESNIAWGAYARSCHDIDTLSDACIGCRDRRTLSIAVLDDATHSPLGQEHVHKHTSCGGVTRTFLLSRLLGRRWSRASGNWTSEVAAAAPLRSVSNWDRMHAMMRQLVVSAPAADWLLKVDCDAFLNLRQLRATLLDKVQFSSTRPPDYYGRPIKVFTYKGERLTFFQGGAYVLSRRAALAVAACRQAQWRRCPNRLLQDTSNAAVNAQLKASCVIRQTSTYAEDLWVGVCLHEASREVAGGLESSAHNQCMLTMFGGAQEPLATGAGVVAAETNTTRRLMPLHLDAEQEKAVWRKAKLNVARKCACPISVHPLKSVALLQRMRNYSESRGCA